MATVHNAISGLQYRWFADEGTDVLANPFGAGYWEVHAAALTFPVATSAAPGLWTVERFGIALEVKTGTVGRMFITYWTGTHTFLRVEINGVTPTATATEVMRYVYTFAATIPAGGTSYMTAPVTMNWAFGDGRILQGETLGATEIPDPLVTRQTDPTFALGLVNAYIQDGAGNQRGIDVHIPLFEEFCSRGSVDMGGGLLFGDVDVGYLGSDALYGGNIMRYMRNVDGAGTVETRVAIVAADLVPLKNLSIWEARSGALFYAASDCSNNLTAETTYLNRSLDGGRTWELVTTMWSNEYRHAVAIGLVGKGAFSAAIKRNTNPSEIWCRVSGDGSTWTADPVYVGNCLAPFKEPLNVYQDHTGALYVMTGNRKWRSDNAGVSWAVMPT